MVVVVVVLGGDGGWWAWNVTVGGPARMGGEGWRGGHLSTARYGVPPLGIGEPYLTFPTRPTTTSRGRRRGGPMRAPRSTVDDVVW